MLLYLSHKATNSSTQYSYSIHSIQVKVVPHTAAKGVPTSACEVSISMVCIQVIFVLEYVTVIQQEMHLALDSKLLQQCLEASQNISTVDFAHAEQSLHHFMKRKTIKRLVTVPTVRGIHDYHIM